MKPHQLLLCLVLVLGATSCYKDEVDIASLTNNPFDPDYTGPSVFVFDSTYVDQVLLGQPPTYVPIQVVQLHVREELFLAPAFYSVRFIDPIVDDPVVVNPMPGTNVFRYYRIEVGIEAGIERCYEVALWNDFTTAPPDTLCCTL